MSFLNLDHGWSVLIVNRDPGLFGKVVRNLDVLLKMVEMGVSRFGIGSTSAIHIMGEYKMISERE